MQVQWEHQGKDFSKTKAWVRCSDGHAPLNAHCKLVPARQRVTVSCLVDCSTATSYGLRSSRWPGAAAAMDSSQPHAMDIVAQELCECFSLYWRHEDLHDAGAMLTLLLCLLLQAYTYSCSPTPRPAGNVHMYMWHRAFKTV